MTQTALNRFLDACRDRKGTERREVLTTPTAEFLARAKEDTSLLTTAAGSLTTLHPAGAAWLAMVLGAAIEQGASAKATAPAVVDLFVSWLSRFPVEEPVDYEDDDEVDQDDEGESEDDWEPTPEQIVLLEALPELCRSVVAHLARTPEYRAELIEDDALLERLEALGGLNSGIAWVHEALIRSSGALIVLHPPSGKCFRLRYENVGLCFHLFSLLQIAIGERIAGGRSPDPQVAAVARGEQEDDVTDEAWWHYGDPGWNTPDLNGSIWGEALVRTIPRVKGTQVMLLWPPILESRVWSTNFGPHLQALPADVVVEEELSAADSRVWLQAVGL